MNLHTNPSSTKTRFAIKFLLAMKRLNKRRPRATSEADKHKRYLVIRNAAHVSMAFAVGPRRAWSRAVIDKIRNHRRQKGSALPTKKRRKSARLLRLSRKNPRRAVLGFGKEGDDLRRLVPGGEGMGYCRLLGESAHYIKCLRDQVQVMTTLLHHYSS